MRVGGCKDMTNKVVCIASYPGSSTEKRFSVEEPGYEARSAMVQGAMV